MAPPLLLENSNSQNPFFRLAELPVETAIRDIGTVNSNVQEKQSTGKLLPLFNSTSSYSGALPSHEFQQHERVGSGASSVRVMSAGEMPLMSSLGVVPGPAYNLPRDPRLHVHRPTLQQHRQHSQLAAMRNQYSLSLAQQQLAVAQYCAAVKQQAQVVSFTPGDNDNGIGVRFSSGALTHVLVRVARHVEERMRDEHDPRNGFQVPSIFDEPAWQQTSLPAQWVEIVNWMARIIDPLKLTPEISVYALVLFERFLMASSIPFCSSNWRGIVLTSIVMAQKMQLDNSYHNFQVCYLAAPFNKYHMRAMELEYLSQISFDAYVSIEAYNAWAERMLRTDDSLPRPVRPNLLKVKRRRTASNSDMAGEVPVCDVPSTTPTIALSQAASDENSSTSAKSDARAYKMKRKLSLHTRSLSNPQMALLSMSSVPLSNVPPLQPGARGIPRHARCASALGELSQLSDVATAAKQVRQQTQLALPVDSAGTSLCSSMASSPTPSLSSLSSKLSASSTSFSPSSLSVSNDRAAMSSYLPVPLAQIAAASSGASYALQQRYNVPSVVSPSHSSRLTLQQATATANMNLQQRQQHAALLAATTPYGAVGTSGYVHRTSQNQAHQRYQVVPLTYPPATSGAASAVAVHAQYMRAHQAQLATLPPF